MEILTPPQLLIFMALVLFLLGLLTFVAGLVVLTLYGSGKEVRGLVVETHRLSKESSQKGLADDLAQLVSHTNTLLETLAKITTTTTGVGVFLVILGLALIAAGCILAYQVTVAL